MEACVGHSWQEDVHGIRCVESNNQIRSDPGGVFSYLK